MPTPHRADTPERKQAAQIRKSLDSQIAALRQQKNLTREGRAARMAKAIEDAKAKLTALRDAETQGMTDQAEKLQRQLFGNRHGDDARIASIRDARDRAAQLDKDPDRAAAAMTRADRDGDHVLLRAYAEEAARRSRDPLGNGQLWGGLFTQWADNQTGGTDAVEELQAIGHELSDPGQRLVRESAFGIGVLPEEIRGVGNMKALAAQADQIAELPPTAAEQKGEHLRQFIKADFG
ncbi:MAG: hypothetical protein ACRD3Q_15375 [Terriglobales bacterium]